MVENICSVCEKIFEDKYFDKKQNRCILHNRKTHENNWVIRNGRETEWNDFYVKTFWNFFSNYIQDNIDDNDWISLEYVFFPPYSEAIYEHNSIFSVLDSSSIVEFNDCHFLGVLDLGLETNGRMRSIIFAGNTKFYDEVVLTDIKLSAGISFLYTEFVKSVRIVECSVGDLLEIVNCEVKDSIDIVSSKEMNQIDIKCNKKSAFNLRLHLDNNVKSLRIFDNKISTLNFDTVRLNGELLIDEKSINKLDIGESNFTRKFRLRKTNINNLVLYNTLFEDIFDLYESEIKEAIFERVKFKNMAVFTKTIFHSDIDFKYVKFFDETIFREMKLAKELNLRETSFVINPSFLDIQSTDEKKYDIKVANRETARVIKESFENKNNIIDANSFYALEMIEREKELSWDKNFLEKLVFSFHGWSSNHSQDWLLSLFWIFNISFIASMFGFRLNENSTVLEILDRTLFSSLSIIAIGIIVFNLKKYISNWSLGIVTLIMYSIHSSVMGSYSLDDMSNKINPFSIVPKGQDLTFGMLIFKIIIAYLIYQLIISIRQNTRRK